MTSTSDRYGRAPANPDELPFVAPCRHVDRSAPVRWLKLGWQDVTRAPRQSLSYGAFFVVVTYLIVLFMHQLGEYFVLLGLLSGFIFLRPVLAIGMYSVSYQLQQGLSPRLGYCLREGRRHLSNEMLFAFMLLVVFLVWARAASMVHVFFPVEAHPRWTEILLFLGVGSAVGSIFAAIVFSASAFSLPMMMDRKVDAVTAVVTSINAVLRNKQAMSVWALLVVATVALSFVTAFLGMVVLLPLLGHATWHAYQETVDASAWPVHEEDGQRAC